MRLTKRPNTLEEKQEKTRSIPLRRIEPSSVWVYTNVGRCYRCGPFIFPGVSSIINPAADSINKGIKETGASNGWSSDAMIRGTLLHAMIENYLNGEDPYDVFEDPEAFTKNKMKGRPPRGVYVEAVRPFWDSFKKHYIHRVPKGIAKTHPERCLMESAIWHEIIEYGGTVDYYGPLLDKYGNLEDFDNLVDWKTAKQAFTKSSSGTYPIQATAYTGAINRRFNRKTSKTLIIPVTPDSTDEIEFSAEEMNDTWIEWVCICWAFWLYRLPDRQAVRVVGQMAREYPWLTLATSVTSVDCY